MNTAKEKRIIKLVKKESPDISASKIRSFLYADWNEPEHDKWLNSASEREIASWVISGLC